VPEITTCTHDTGTMELVNIPASIEDSCYRYKRPLVAMIRRSTNGGVTIVSNFFEIAKALARDPLEIGNFIKKRLGCRGKITETSLELAGLYSVEMIEEHLERFIRADVLCPRCGNPETLKIQKKKRIEYSCKACGHRY